MREIASAVAVYDQVLKRRPTHRGARKNRDYLQDVLDGLQQTTDFDELKKPTEDPTDQTAAEFRKDQLQGPQDKAADAEKQKVDAKTSLSQAESERWMKRVATSPADFLRAKFSIQAAREKRP